MGHHFTGKYVSNEIKELKREQHTLTVLEIKINKLDNGVILNKEILLKDENGKSYRCFADKESVFNNNFINKLIEIGIDGQIKASFKSIEKNYFDNTSYIEFYEPRILK